NPFIDRAVIFHPARDSYGRLLWQLSRRRYDLVFDLFCNPRSAQMTFATRAPLRVGYPFRGRGWAYNIHVTTRADRVHNTQFNLDALRALDIPVPHDQLVFPLREDTVSRMQTFVDENRRSSGPCIAMNPSGTWSTKRWPLASFAALADRLNETLRANVFLLWGPGEREDVAQIAAAMKQPACIPPSTTIRELGALLSVMDFTISNDAGPMHISAAVGTPTLGIFGPTNPQLQGPWSPHSAWVRLENLDCLGCNLTRCSIGNICMRDLSVDTVFRAFDTLRQQLPV
ncbi:MAG: glycosyltransferase family 9 protein, partial [Bacteroidetes bacterium]|nr:glycosyltransferase family 9 protein [Bacteroidota bacterium]